MKAIVTKYHGPGNVKGSRYSASDEDGNRVILDGNDALNSDENHDAACRALCHKMGWTGTLQRGSLRTGYVYVFVIEGGEYGRMVIPAKVKAVQNV